MATFVNTSVQSPILNPPNAQVAGFLQQDPSQGVQLPWTSTPEGSWLDYRCWVEVELDPGIVLHKPLPQQNWPGDTLAQVDCQAQNLDTLAQPPNNSRSGVNITSNSRATDLIQRMATSTYRFVLRGFGRRAGYQIPIPGLFRVGNQTPVPVWPQRATNYISGNYCGVPIWTGVWELHYVVVTSPSGVNAVAPVPYNPAFHIRPDATLPYAINLPATQPDQAHRTGTPATPPGGGTLFTSAGISGVTTGG